MDAKTRWLHMAGNLALVNLVLFLALVLWSVKLYPGYSFTGNYLSDLGVHKDAGVFFNSAVILMGLALLFFSAMVYRGLRGLDLTIPLALLGTAGLALAGVGIFDSNNEPYHMISATVFFAFTALSCLTAARTFFAKRLGKALLVLGVLGLSFFLVWQYPLAQKLTVGMWLGALAAAGLGLSLKAERISSWA